MSPANTSNRAAPAAPTACSRTARTDSSADVEATASVHPACNASSAIRAIPGRAGSPPARTIALYRAVLRQCQSASISRWSSPSVAKTCSCTNSSVSSEAIRSLPPPILSFTPYSSSDQRTGNPTSANVSLKAGRWPSRSVSASTPSQSKISAGTRSAGGCRERPRPARGPEDADVVLGHRLDGCSHLGEQRRRIMLTRICVQVLPVRVDERDLQCRRDVHLRAAARDQVEELLLFQSRAAVQHHRDRVQLDELGDPVGLELGGVLVEAVRGPDRRREAVDPGLLDEPRGDLDRMNRAGLVGADVVLDPEDGLDLALHLGPVTLGFGHHLDSLAGVLGDIERRAVEQDRVPAGPQARRYPFSVGAV